MRDLLTTILESVAGILIVLGVGLLLGPAWALVAAGVALLAFSWAISGAPLPRRKP